VTPFEQAVVNLHYGSGVSMIEAESILKGTGIAPIEEED
jgi:hypothetical protein